MPSSVAVAAWPPDDGLGGVEADSASPLLDSLAEEGMAASLTCGGVGIR